MYRIIGSDGQQYGPVSVDQLRVWLAENRVNAQTLVQAEGAQDWKPLAACPDLAASLRVPPPLSVPPLCAAPPSPYAAKASNKIPAGIFGIVLGALGIHKFVLGYTGAGLIMLLVTVLTCFAAWPIMHLIGLVEGIIYLTKTDEEFVRTYVEGRREWF